MSNDMSMMRFWINVLNVSFGEPRVLIDSGVIAQHYNIENWCGMYQSVLQQFGLRVAVPFVLVQNMPHKSRPAYLVWKDDFHTALTRRTTRRLAALCVNTEFLNHASYYATVIMLAHECAHILLESKNHPLRAYEKFVDLTAMHFGFSEYFLYGSHCVAHNEDNNVYGYGYLNETEHAYAARHLGYQPAY